MSNVPTVASSALAGMAIGAFSQGDMRLLSDWRSALPVVAACCAFYIAGMALNDLMDRHIDARERPRRPIPSGRISPEGAAAFASILVVGGLWLLSFGAMERLIAGIALVGCIVLYNVLHTRTRLSVLVMGLCRALVYVTAALSFGPLPQVFPVVVCGLILLLYVAAFSMIARHEAAAAPRDTCGRCGYPVEHRSGVCPECGAAREAPTGLQHGLTRSMAWAKPYLLLVLLLAAAVALPFSFPLHRARTGEEIVLVVLLCLVVSFMAGWLNAAAKQLAHDPPRIGAAVTMWIAAISLFDGYIAILAGSAAIGLASVACFALTRIAQRFIAGT
ncbi:MAG: UbiA family prenyltransferase [Phycisphaerae bacterium]|nr:UbiA family prenyltransferase [Phycisphaerae bacterium]